MRTPGSGGKRRVTALLPALLGAVVTIALAAAVSAAEHWTYSGEEGPDHWASLESDFALCAAGRQQSPVDLSGAAQRDVANPQMAYTATDGRIVNNGHTIQTELRGGSSLILDGVTYQLIQFHFHSPSEHTIGGQSFPVEIHLVHRSDSGALAVVGVLVSGGAPNDALGSLAAAMPTKAGKEARLSAPFDPTVLLPPDRRAYRYAGSLTTPPCSEGVSWLVMANPIQASGPQIAALARVLHGNSRPTQPGNGREIVLDTTP
jgi:carbonic anhydrase